MKLPMLKSVAIQAVPTIERKNARVQVKIKSKDRGSCYIMLHG